MTRIFVYDGREMADPDPSMTIEQVRDALAEFYPELTNARHERRSRGDEEVYEFRRTIGTKGSLRS